MDRSVPKPVEILDLEKELNCLIEFWNENLREKCVKCKRLFSFEKHHTRIKEASSWGCEYQVTVFTCEPGYDPRY